MKYEDLLRRFGSFGLFQKKLCVIIFVAGIPNPLTNIMFVFTQQSTNFHCKIPKSGIKSTLQNETFFEYLAETNVSKCKVPTSITNDSLTPKDCTDGWVYDNYNSAIAEFDLVCDNAWKAPFAISLYMIGMSLSGVSGKISDRFGRRPVFLFATYAQFILAGVTSLSTNYGMYAVSVLLVGFFGLINYITAFVLSTEMIGVELQKEVAFINYLAYSLGYTISPLVSYCLPHWRWYLRFISLLGILYIPLIWLFPESLRWLIASGKIDEAKEMVKIIAKTNQKNLDVDEIFKEDINVDGDSEKNKLVSSNKLKNVDVLKESSFCNMMNNRIMAIRMTVMYFCWFVVSVVYFAISLNPTYLTGERLLNVFIAGLIEFPAYYFAFLCHKKVGGPRTLFLVMTIAGIACCISPFTIVVSPALATSVVMVGKFMVSAAFGVVYLLASEITPTLVRNTSMGIASFSARIGVIVMPYLMFAGEENATNHFVPFFVMAALSLVCATLAIFVIPETSGIPMPDTIEEAINNKRIYRCNVCKNFESKNGLELGETVACEQKV